MPTESQSVCKRVLYFVPGIHLVLASSKSGVVSPSTRDFSEQFHTKRDMLRLSTSRSHISTGRLAMRYLSLQQRVIETFLPVGVLACNMFNGWNFTHRLIPRQAEWQPAEIQARCGPATKCLQAASKLALKVLEWCSCH